MGAGLADIGASRGHSLFLLCRSPRPAPSAERPSWSRPTNDAVAYAVNEPGGMQGDDKRFTASSETSGRRLPRIVGSASASAALLQLHHDRGPQVIELGTCCAAVSIARVRDRRDFSPHEYHVRLGVVAHCSVYADIRQIELCPHEILVIELHAAPHGGSPVFVTRPESRAERQQRVFAERARAAGLC